ncbi:MAG: endonuclease/exonuclease/phosphatase family protein [Clostridia bacterium]|nr:endonuclease/exonuclease/phosphatase family protein [Clostridia bacterium]
MKKILTILIAILMVFSCFLMGCQLPMLQNPNNNDGGTSGDASTDDGGSNDSGSNDGGFDWDDVFGDDEDDNVDLDSGITSFSTSNLSKYSIVYDSNESDTYTAAVTLQACFLIKYGIDLTIKSDRYSKDSNCEILIGDTNRYSASGKVMKYSVTVDGATLKINVGGLYSAQKAMEYLTQNVFTGKQVNLASGEYYSKSFITNTQGLTSGTTARIMTSNVLADEFNTSADYNLASYRAEIYAGILGAYTPDVIGVQETDDNWNKVLDRYLAKVNREYSTNYQRAVTTYNDKVNFSSIIYRADKFTLNNSGYTNFTWKSDANLPNDNYYMRGVAWVQLTSKTNSSKKLVLANTHWSYGSEYQNIKLTNGTTVTLHYCKGLCKNETVTKINSLKSTYSGMPLFLTGDFNASASWFTSGGTYASFSNTCSLLSSKVNKTPGTGTYDHIFGTGTYTVKSFVYIDGINEIDLLSDHPFAYSDVSF